MTPYAEGIIGAMARAIDPGPFKRVGDGWPSDWTTGSRILDARRNARAAILAFLDAAMEPSREMSIESVKALADANAPFAGHLRGEGETRAWAALSCVSSRQTIAVYRAMRAALLREFE